jgi:Zn-dependent alcohol dehydrogenase
MAPISDSAWPGIDALRLLSFQREGKLKLDELITRFGLSDVNEAFEVIKRGEVAPNGLNFEPVR